MMTWRPWAILLASTAAVAFVGSAIAAPNLVVNPGFDTGFFPPWVSGGDPNTFVGGGANSPLFAANMGCVGGGCVTVGPTGVSGPGSITQTINLEPGIYQLSYFLQSPGNTPNLYAVSLGNNVVFNQSNIVAAPYTPYSFISAASGGATNLAFGVRQDVNFGHIDDVSLIEIDDGAGNNIGAASQTVAAQASREFMDQLYDRFGHSGSPMQLASAGEVVVASNDAMTYINGPGNYRAFVSVYGDQARWDSGDVRSHRMSFIVGAEWAPCNDWDIGLAIGNATSHFKTDTFFTDNRGRADETLGALYTNWSPHNGPFYATGVIGYGSSSNDFMRESPFGFGAVGAYGVSTKQWFGGVEAGFDWRGWSHMTLTPFARVDAARLKQDSYMEKKEFGDLVPAFVDAKDQTAARSLLGLRVKTDLNLAGRYPWQLSGKVAWQHDFDRNRSVTFSETTGPVTFFGTATGATPVANSAVVGASLEVPLTGHASLYAGYNGNFGSGQRIHEGEVGFRVTW